MSLHAELLQYILRDFSACLLTQPKLTQDAITVSLNNGVILTVRYAAADAYSLRWHGDEATVGGAQGIDTSPTHPDLATYPNHLHLTNGRVVADPLTHPDATPEANVRAVIEALLRDPTLAEFLP
ncbi:MAG: hypothetical protein Q7J47_10055 [Azoarcus sp.]|nr:hypothetical protein [Azoarcus sp.]